MKERPIIFNSEMVRAILEGRKTQTRRLLKPQPTLEGTYWFWKDCMWTAQRPHCPIGNFEVPIDYCPYGKIGDRLWVKEKFALECDREYVGEVKLPNDRPIFTVDEGEYFNSYHKWPHYAATDEAPSLVCEDDKCAKCERDGEGPHWQPSIHMPRWASRITLEITDIRVERLQDICEEDALFEGVGVGIEDPRIKGEYPMPTELFRDLWKTIYTETGPKGWAANPWVWVIEFRRVK